MGAVLPKYQVINNSFVGATEKPTVEATFAALTFTFVPLVVICERKENFNRAHSKSTNKMKGLTEPRIQLSRLSFLGLMPRLPVFVLVMYQVLKVGGEKT